MKQLFPTIISGLLLLISLSGCISIKGYVDPELRSVSYGDLKHSRLGPSLGALVEFQRDGKPYAPGTGQARKTVLRVLKKTNLFSFVSSGVVNTEAQLNVIINNTDGETKGSGTVTGLTGGALGTATIDRYIISAAYKISGSQLVNKKYRHAIHGTVGNSSPPEGLKPMTISDAFDSVVEQVVLLFLFDLQQEGKL